MDNYGKNGTDNEGRDFIPNSARAQNAQNAERSRINGNKKSVLAVIFAALFIAVFFLGYFVRGFTGSEYHRKFDEIVSFLNDYAIYADGDNVDDIAKGLINGLREYDKYAVYYTAEEYAVTEREDRGNYSGVGISLDNNGNVVRVYLNSSAHSAGVLAGDRLVAGVFKGESDFSVFEERLADFNADKPAAEQKTLKTFLSEFFAEYDKDETLNIKVSRGGAETEFSLTKTDYTVCYVEYADNASYIWYSYENGVIKSETDESKKIEYLSDGSAYIRLHGFEGDAARQFKNALDYMRENGKENLILDLRKNGGGLMSVLQDIASYLIHNNGQTAELLSARGKNVTTTISANGNRFYDNIKKIAVIADSGTASASECLIGALATYGRADLGENRAAFTVDDNLILTEYNAVHGNYSTYGKGIMQTTFRLKNGGALKITTAEIYWPKPNDTKCIHDKGITTKNTANRVSDDAAIARAQATF